MPNETMTHAEMLASVAEYQEQQALASPDQAVREAAQKSRDARIGVKAPEPVTLANMTEAQFRAGLDGNSALYGAPGNVVQVANEYLKLGLHPDYATRYGLDEKGNVSKADYDGAVIAKGLHMRDRAWMAKLAAGDVDAIRRWATISFLIAAGPRPEAVK